jgi:hypothetical protein
VLQHLQQHEEGPSIPGICRAGFHHRSQLEQQRVSKLINEKAVKAFALERVQVVRAGWKATRVSRQFLDQVNAQLRTLIDNKLRQHPSRGETIVWE